MSRNHYGLGITKFKVAIKANRNEHPIAETGNYRDPAQKNLEILKQTIGLRTLIHSDKPPRYTIGLKKDISSISGNGFVYIFSIEGTNMFEEGNNGVKLLLDDLDGIVLHTGLVLKSRGTGKNVDAKVIL